VSRFDEKDDVTLQLLKHQERVAESRERQVNLRKDLAEMQEWMTQVDEEFLMRDFEYKSPEELEASLEEMKVGGVDAWLGIFAKLWEIKCDCLI